MFIGTHVVCIYEPLPMWLHISGCLGVLVLLCMSVLPSSSSAGCLDGVCTDSWLAERHLDGII